MILPDGSLVGAPGRGRGRQVHGRTVLRITGFLCMLFSTTLLPPLLVSLWYRDGEAGHLAVGLLVMAGSGLLLWLSGLGRPVELRRRDGFLLVALFWCLLSLLGLFPFLFGLELSPVDALFESVSGLTTTGATVLSGLDGLPPSLLFYRQEIQWFGGMGLIVLAVAIMPMLGIGGMSIYRAEAPGPMKDEKMTPRLAHGARALWMLYLGITVACALAFWGAGMTPFDAIAHSLSTVSTGGFSTHDASMAWFDSPTIEWIASLFMLLGSINFAIHYLAVTRHDIRCYWQDTEVRTFLLLIVAAVLLISLMLERAGLEESWRAAVRHSTFEVVSVITSTGFGVESFASWPLFLPVLMLFISFVGGCGGSTAGGMKVMRVLVLAKLGWRELRRLPHPRSVLQIKIGGRRLREQTLQAIWGFFAVYVATFVILMLSMMATGLDQVTAFSAIATCMNNLGPGLGEVSETFAGIGDTAKLVAVAAMLLGRLEVFTILVLLQPAYWRD